MAPEPQHRGGEAEPVREYGEPRFDADWNNPGHRVRRLLAELLGMAGLMVILSGVAAILARFAGADVPPCHLVAIAVIASGAHLIDDRRADSAGQMVLDTLREHPHSPK